MKYGNVKVDIWRTKTADVLASADFLPFREEKFDLVFSRCVFEHLPNALNALLEQKRVCKKGGKIEVITDNAGYWAYHVVGFHTERVAKIGEKGRKYIDKHYALYTCQHLKNLFSLVGLVPIRIGFMDFGTKVDIINRAMRVVKILKNLSYPRIQAIGFKEKR